MCNTWHIRCLEEQNIIYRQFQAVRMLMKMLLLCRVYKYDWSGVFYSVRNPTDAIHQGCSLTSYS